MRKKYGGVRPIAPGHTLRRPVAKWLLACAVGLNAAAALSPLKTAFGREAPATCWRWPYRGKWTHLNGSTGRPFLQVDLKNAFTSIAPPAILEALGRRCPSTLPWVRQGFQPEPLLVRREGGSSS